MRRISRLLLSAPGCALAALRLGAVSVEEATIADLHAAYLSGQSSAREVTAAYLARIDAYDKKGPHLNTVINLNPTALKDAAALDAQLAATGKPVGPLHGIPVVLKDNLDAVGVPMTNGFQGWKNYVPPSDAPLVARIKAAGGIIIAKVSLSEFAMGGADNINSVLGGFARNPYNTAYATGGSSGGTGAALAASFAVVGIGTDTGGSVRMPAAHNALAGLRPTVGLVSRTGVAPLDGHRDTAGPMARTVRDMAILLEVMAGADPEDPATALSAGRIPPSYSAQLKNDGLKGVRLGVLRQAFKPALTDPIITANFEKTIAELKAAGAEIIDPFTVPELDMIPRPPQTRSSFKADLTAWLLKHRGIPYPSVKELAESRLVHPLHQAAFDEAVTALPPDRDERTIKGLKDEQTFRDAFTREMDAAKADALIFPTWAQLPVLNGDRNTQIGNLPKPAPNALPTHSGSSLTFVGSMLQWPALSVPSGYAGEGLPLGLQILGRAWDEAKIIAYAFAYEQATHYRRPPASVPPLAESLTSKLVGTWTLIAIRDRSAATGVETPATRAADGGQLIYSPDGRLSVQIVRAGREQSASASADGFSSYFGRWELVQSEGCVIHHQEGNLNASQVGQAAKRYYSFDSEGHLSLATPPRKRDNGQEVSSVFVWARL